MSYLGAITTDIVQKTHCMYTIMKLVYLVDVKSS